MARMRIALFAALGVFLALAIIPQTRWVLINDLASLRGGPGSPSFAACLNSSSWSGDKHELARAVLTAASNGPEGNGRDAQLLAYCHAHPDDVAAWAHLIRAETRMPLGLRHVSNQTPPNAAVSGERQRRFTVIREAIRNGERLEPNNLYFPLLQCLIEAAEGNRDQARKTLIRASRLDGFDDHAQEEPPIVYAAALDACGYRGNAMRIAIEASLIFPHISWLMDLSEVVKNPDGAGDPTAQAAAMRAAHTMAKRANFTIAVVVGKSVFRKAATLKSGVREFPDSDVSEAVSELDRKLGGQELQGYWLDFQKVDFRRAQSEQGSGLGDDLANASRPAAFALFAILLALLGGPLVLLATGISKVKAKLFRTPALVERPWLWVLWSVAFAGSLVGLFVVSVYYRAEGFLSFGNVSPRGPISNAELQAICWAIATASVVFLPRRGVSPWPAVMVLWIVSPLFYLGHVVNTLRVDQQLGQYEREVPKELQRVRGNW